MSEDHPDPRCIVADVDVLVADLFIGKASREALDILRAHDWLTLIATDELITEATVIIEELSSAELASQWESRFRREAVVVEPVLQGNAALVAAAAGNAATVLSLDERLQSSAAGTAIRSHLATSVKSPHAFNRLLDPEQYYVATGGEPGGYTGPDRDPRR